ncbi:unnamed protein product [Trichogramma brassicae]|uniref:Uncharacterized protein n=1 Tax=Trichogramma brassicae TaxID=86971 RepID=A0A6H5I246_9HYME|nr:unnamed protein product [Trichogramma brassicae]
MVVSHREGNISSNIRAIIEQLNLNPTERDRLQQCSNNSSSIKQQQQIQQRNNHHIASPMMMRLAPKNNHHRPEPADRPRVTIGVYGLNNHHHNNNNNNNNESNMNSSNDSCEPKQWSKKIQYDNVEEYKHEKKVLIRKFEANNNVVDLQVAKKPIKIVNDIGDIENSTNKPQIVTKNNKLDKEMENIIKKAPELRKVLPTKIDNTNNKLESFLSKPAWSVKPSNNKIEGILKKPMKKIEDCVNDDQQNDVSVITKKDVAADDNNLPKKPIWKIDDAKKKVEELSKQIMRKFENNVEEAKVSVINLTQKSNDDDGAKKNNNNDLRRPLKKIEDKDIKLMSVELVTELQKRKTVHKVVARPRQRQPAANEIVLVVPLLFASCVREGRIEAMLMGTRHDSHAVNTHTNTHEWPIGNENSETFRKQKIDLAIEEERDEFLRRLDSMDQISANLRDIFPKEDIEYLLVDSVKKMHKDRSYCLRNSFIDFALLTGYKDEPDLDEDGKPLWRRATPLHRVAGRRCNDFSILFPIINTRVVPQLFRIYDRFDVNYTDETGLSHFHVACQFGQYEIVEKFLESGQVHPDCLPRSESDARYIYPPLHLALAYNRKRVAELLLRGGADPNLANEYGSTPLHVICQRKYDDDSTKLFFEICDDTRKTVRVNALDKSGRTPLRLAVANLLPNTVQVLFDRGADLSTFVFPTKIDFGEKFKAKHRQIFEFGLASSLLLIVERLERRGYELDQRDALTIMSLFAHNGVLEKSTDLEKTWCDDERFATGAKRTMIAPSLSLYDLIQLRAEKAAKLLTSELPTGNLSHTAAHHRISVRPKNRRPPRRTTPTTAAATTTTAVPTTPTTPTTPAPASLTTATLLGESFAASSTSIDALDSLEEVSPTEEEEVAMPMTTTTTPSTPTTPVVVTPIVVAAVEPSKPIPILRKSSSRISRNSDVFEELDHQKVSLRPKQQTAACSPDSLESTTNLDSRSSADVLDDATKPPRPTPRSSSTSSDKSPARRSSAASNRLSKSPDSLESGSPMEWLAKSSNEGLFDTMDKDAVSAGKPIPARRSLLGPPLPVSKSQERVCSNSGSKSDSLEALNNSDDSMERRQQHRHSSSGSIAFDLRPHRRIQHGQHSKLMSKSTECFDTMIASAEQQQHLLQQQSIVKIDEKRKRASCSEVNLSRGGRFPAKLLSAESFEKFSAEASSDKLLLPVSLRRASGGGIVTTNNSNNNNNNNNGSGSSNKRMAHSSESSDNLELDDNCKLENRRRSTPKRLSRLRKNSESSELGSTDTLDSERRNHTMKSSDSDETLDSLEKDLLEPVLPVVSSRKSKEEDELQSIQPQCDNNSMVAVVERRDDNADETADTKVGAFWRRKTSSSGNQVVESNKDDKADLDIHQLGGYLLGGNKIHENGNNESKEDTTSPALVYAKKKQMQAMHLQQQQQQQAQQPSGGGGGGGSEEQTKNNQLTNKSDEEVQNMLNGNISEVTTDTRSFKEKLIMFEKLGK